ncbi:MAG: acyl-CoA dehydrogenase family protein [Polyangiaceae bacterium]
MPDHLELSRHLSDAERELQQAVKNFTDERVLPRIDGDWERGIFPAELVPEIASLGLLGGNLEGFGCAGLSEVAYGLAMQELERGDSGIRSFASVQGALAMYPIHAYGSEDQKASWLPAMARGEVIGCFALTEPETGSNPRRMQTIAVDDGDAYVIRGTKRWVTNGSIAQVALVWAKLGGVDGEVRGFLVPTGARGVDRRVIERKVSLRASVTSELSFDDVRVSKGAVLPGVRGMKGPLSCLTAARLSIGWGVIGAATACFDCAVDYAMRRSQFGGRPIASHQLVQAKFADALTAITSMQLLAFEVSRLKEERRVRPAQVSLLKRHNARAAIEVARSCRDVLGANGITLDYPVIRHLCNLETVVTYEGTHDIHTLIIGQDVTGISAFE